MDQDHRLRDFFQSGFYQQFWPEADDENNVKERAAKIASLLEARQGHKLDFDGNPVSFDSRKIVLIAKK